MNEESIKKYRQAFNSQKSRAKYRGIEFQLTFEEWLSWWGDDIERRGYRKSDLQMQRIGDSGPYAIGNIKKGMPKQNADTRAKIIHTKKAIKAKLEHEAFLDSLMFATSKEEKDEIVEEEYFDNPSRNGVVKHVAFAIDKYR